MCAAEGGPFEFLVNYGPEFFAIALAHALAVASPGPDFALVLRQSLAHGRATALATAAGIGSGILVHVTYALLGLGWLVRSQGAILTVVQYAGAAYLGWLGWCALRSRGPVETTVPAARYTAPGVALRGAWLRGFLTNVLNPKATLFFLALFAVGIDAATPKWVQAGYGVWMAGATTVWFAVVGLVLTRDRVRAAFLRGGVWIDRALGLVFWALAAGLLLAPLQP